jgi:hypothetical protein
MVNSRQKSLNAVADICGLLEKVIGLVIVLIPLLHLSMPIELQLGIRIFQIMVEAIRMMIK